MKNLYLSILIAVFICGAPSQARAQVFSASDFQSTSVMTSGTSLPQAAVGDPTLAEEPMMGVSGPRRAWGEDEEGGNNNLDPDDPSQNGGMDNPNGPIGAVPMLLMALLAAAYALFRKREIV